MQPKTINQHSYMKKSTFLIFFLIFSSLLFSQHQEGDTLKIRVHDKTDMSTYGNSDVWGLFPSKNLSFRKITMHYTLGCASGGCGEWDYTTKIELLRLSGKLDSTNAPEKIGYELARLMTPYGNYMNVNMFGFNNDWSITHSFDVTDFAPFLRDSVEIRAFYDGWSSGFSVSLDFEMIVGTPPRNVISINNLWKGYFNYENSQDFETQYLYPLNYKFSKKEKAASIKFIPSAHGFVNEDACAEFCSRYYNLKINQEKLFSANMWNDKCGSNPTYPQAGTWIYNRANWCPGLPCKIFIHEITPYINYKDSVEIDFDIEDYTWNGEQGPFYYIESQFFTYGKPNFSQDAEMIDIIASSRKNAYARHNPIFKSPIIVVRNSGSKPISEMDIEYGVVGFRTEHYKWTGNLNFMESDTIFLPTFEWQNAQNQIFEAKIASTNLKKDQNPKNNSLRSEIQNINIINTDKIVVELKTNLASEENAWEIRDCDGKLLASRNNLDSNQLYSDTVALINNQCYVFELMDSGGDGLSFFGNKHGNGHIWIRKAESDEFVKIFNANFGNKIEYIFLVNTSFSTDNKEATFDFKLYPNPAKTRIMIETSQFIPEKIIVSDKNGKTLSHLFTILDESTFTVNLSELEKGNYTMTLHSGENKISKEFSIE